jgi:hypothetical protein
MDFAANRLASSTTVQYLSKTVDSTSQFDDTPPHNNSSQILLSKGEEVMSSPKSVFEEELMPLEYARLNGLCEDFSKTHPLQLFASQATTKVFIRELQDPEGVFSLDPSVHCLLPERLEIPANVQSFLQSCLYPPSDLFLETIPARRSHSTYLKLEPPLLSTDNELDILHFSRVAQPDFSGFTFPREELHTENDESLQWPSAYLELPQKYQKKLESEKLEMDSSATKYLVSIVRDEPGKEVTGPILEVETNCVKVFGSNKRRVNCF